jgi:hypothetical protein
MRLKLRPKIATDRTLHGVSIKRTICCPLMKVYVVLYHPLVMWRSYSFAVICPVHLKRRTKTQ